MTKIKIAIVDDHEKFRKAITRLLHIETDLEVIFEAENGIDLLRQLEKISPDIILMDIRMPLMNGIETTKEIVRLYPTQKIFAFSQYDNEQNIVEMFIQGTKSFIGKSNDPEELFNAIRIVYQGGHYMTEESIKIISQHLSLASKKDDGTKEVKKLTRTELTVLYHVAHGYSLKEIACKLFISLNTVNNHQYNIRKKLKLSGRMSLKAYGIEIKDILISLAKQGHFVIVEE
jgi:two-component system response regulator DegU